MIAMNRESARDYVNSLDITSLYPFTKSKGYYMYDCPVCGSGKGANRTGGLSIRPGKKIRCFARCVSLPDGGLSKGEDVLGALRILWECSEDEVFKRVIGEDWKGKDESSFSAKPFKAMQKERAASTGGDVMTNHEALNRWKERTRNYIAEAQESLSDHSEAMEYLQKRGITEESVKRFGLGYDVERKGIVIPYNRTNTYYALRRIDDNASFKYMKPKGSIEGVEVKIPEPLFNSGALGSGKPVFVVESQLCAISIIQAVPSAMAVALGGTGSEKLLNELKREENKNVVLILCLDNDMPGKEAQAKLKARLSEANVAYYEYNIAGAYKDPNEALVADEGGLIEGIYNALALAEEANKKKAEEYITKNSNKEPLLALSKEVHSFIPVPCVSTGFKGLDTLLEGGLHSGLYVVGAISSLGKTTLCMQIMDNIASSGLDVLVFSLEMSKKELIGKSVSRHTFQRATETYEDWETGIRRAKTYWGIIDGSRFEKYSMEEKKLIEESIIDYGRYANKVFIEEGMGDIGIIEIRNKVKEHIAITGKKPVVFVDYLQIIAPYKDPDAPNRSFTDKQTVDKNVLELKRLSRDFDIPVLAVSSLNRANYNNSMNMAAFKESGAIEYSADVLIGLEYNKIKESELEEIIEKNSQKSEAGEPIEVKVKILKQRAGARGTSCLLDYYMLFNAFVEQGEEMIKPEGKQESFIDVTDDIDVPF